jgi:predicted phosphodiesterase
MMRLVIASDTHGHVAVTVPDGDVFIHAGDLTSVGDLTEISNVGKWICGLPHRNKIVIAGIHDRGFEEQPLLAQKLLGAADAIPGVRVS